MNMRERADIAQGVQNAALVQIWDALGVTNQTQAMVALRRLLPPPSSPVVISLASLLEQAGVAPGTEGFAAAAQDALDAIRPAQDVCCEVLEKVRKAEAAWPPFNSAHEGFGVLLEEVDELKAHVWMKQGNRDIAAMRSEAIDVAAVAVRFVLNVITQGRARK